MKVFTKDEFYKFDNKNNFVANQSNQTSTPIVHVIKDNKITLIKGDKAQDAINNVDTNETPMRMPPVVLAAIDSSVSMIRTGDIDPLERMHKNVHDNSDSDDDVLLIPKVVEK